MKIKTPAKPCPEGRTDCEMKGFLSFIVLRMVAKREICGDEIRKELGKKRGSVPSAGTIYPVLKDLKEKGLIEEMTLDGRMKKYRITERGRKEVDFATKRFLAMFSDMKEEFRKA